MEFHENRAKAPFIGLVQLWQAVRRWRRQMHMAPDDKHDLISGTCSHLPEAL